MKLLYAQSNLERVLEQENFDHLTFQYYDNSQIIPEIGMTNADYMRRVVKAVWNLHRILTVTRTTCFYRKHRSGKNISHQLHCQKADGYLSFRDLFFCQ